VAPYGLTVITFIMLFTAIMLQTDMHYDRDLARYTPQRVITALDTATWWNTEWQILPPYRIDLEGRGKQPLTVQWSGPLPVLIAHLQEQGWQAPPRLTGRNALQWLVPAPALRDLPLLPQAHDGRYDVLRLVHAAPDPQRLVVLRLWSANYELRNPDRALWVGSVTFAHAATHIPWLTVPITGANFDEPLKTLQTTLHGLEWKTVRRPKEEGMPWDGTVVLIRENG
jgi:undecaprenyl-diphosphatase